MSDQSAESNLLEQRALQFLVHAFLYYRLNEPVVDDAFFDRIAEDLRGLRGRIPEADMPHAALIDPVLGPEGSAFSIRRYPQEIITTAFKVLYLANDPGVEFREFVERRGYRVESVE